MLSRMHRVVLVACLAFSQCMVGASLGNNASQAFAKDVAPILQEKCQRLPSRGIDGADVAGDLR